MILAEHAVSGITPVVLLEDNVLLVLAALNDLVGASLELSTKLADQGHNEGCHDREDELGKLLLKLLNDLGKNGDLLECSGDALTQVH